MKESGRAFLGIRPWIHDETTGSGVAAAGG